MPELTASDKEYNKSIKRALNRVRRDGVLHSRNMLATLLFSGFIKIINCDDQTCVITEDGEALLAEQNT